LEIWFDYEQFMTL